MCGFVVVAGRSGSVSAPMLANMADALTHRGPDGEGACFRDGVGMHHKRLAIIDSVGGAQPMIADEVALVFNGEIYNYPELRRTLETQGQIFLTDSDTEVLLRGYLVWGEQVVTKLNGMFSFVLHDRRRRCLLAARDPFGIKPLYRAKIGSQLVYASEIKALLRHPQMHRRLDSIALEDYLSLQFVMGERTMFDGVEKVRPATYELTDLGSTEPPIKRQYWSLPTETEDGRVEAGEIEALIHASVQRQLRSDVPVGAMLSGGLDSSTIAAFASKHQSGRLPTFTGAFNEGPAYDESRHARVVAEHIDARMHTIYPSEQQFVQELPEMVYAMDEPAAGPGLFPQFVVARSAGEQVKVCLGGQGGDEIFVGYARYLIGALQESLGQSIRGEAITRSSLSLSLLEPSLSGLTSYQPLMKRVLGAGIDLPGHERYFQILNRLDASADILGPDLRTGLGQSLVHERFGLAFDRGGSTTHLKKMMQFDLNNSLPALLHVEDRASMAASLESRVPFLDTALIEKVMSVPDRRLLEGGFSKAILRGVARKHLPRSIVERNDKMGFPVPLQKWIKGPVREFVRDVLLSQRSRERGLFDPDRLSYLVDHEAEFGRSLWGALQLELWHRQFIDADHRDAGINSNQTEPALTTL
ncbi:MAG: asparagine synthase (glutamine-hydrolyzing) [Burkholderiaceae bacterium]